MQAAVNAEHPEPRVIRRAVDALERDGVIAYPTDTAYALGCDLASRKGFEKLCALRGLDKKHLFTFLCPDLGDIAKYAVVENQHYRVLRRFLPGPYVFVLQATREIPKIAQSKRQTVGIRVPGHAVPIAIARELGRPLITATAIDEDGDPMVDSAEVDQRYAGLALVLDGGDVQKVQTSVVDLTTEPATVIRAGVGDVSEFSDD
jgi:tRNA threonylcarbamoyl adenosine modification protein (Sua5/YciO/YrdC/YwlC family)